MKTILIVSGGIEAVAAIRRAKELDLFVVVSDRDPDAPGFAIADSHIVADVYSPEQTAAAAERFHRKVQKIDGVICVAADAPLTMAAVTDRLGLPGISLEAARLASDKLAMKERLFAAGVPIPWFSAVATPQALQRSVVERGTNLVIKPVDSRGSRGVQRLTHVNDLDQAFYLAQSHSPTERVMIEEYLEGPQVSTESVIIGGHCYTPGFSDRNYEFLDRYAPFFIENGGDLPSILPPKIQSDICDVLARAAAALDITDGTVKGDIVVHNNRAHVIELAARLSGGFFCTHEIPLSTGVDFVGTAIRVALREPVSSSELEPKYARPVSQRYAFPNPGRVTKIDGTEAAKTVSGVAELVVTAKLGDVIPPAGDKRPSAAMVVATGASRKAAQQAARDAVSRLRIETV